MTAVFERIAVIGLGLLGGSVARAVKKTGAANHVAGATRRHEVLDAALAQGIIDTAGTPEQVVVDADLVLLATPVFAMATTVREIAPYLADGSIVTDVGSVKAILHETLPGLLPRGARYIGSHPMAGSHERGLERSRADLFQGASCVVTETAHTPEQRRLCDFWRSLGARVVEREPAEHDLEVAWMSHIPHVMAYAFSDALSAAPAGAADVAGAGFEDFTRIARSEPELWGDILTANRKALSAPLQAVGEALARIGRAIEANDAYALEHAISDARDSLSRHPLRGRSEPDDSGEGHPQSPRSETNRTDRVE